VRTSLDVGLDRVVLGATSSAAHERLRHSLLADRRVRVVAAGEVKGLGYRPGSDGVVTIRGATRGVEGEAFRLMRGTREVCGYGKMREKW